MSWMTAARVLLITTAATMGHLHGRWTYEQKKMEQSKNSAQDTLRTAIVAASDNYDDG